MRIVVLCFALISMAGSASAADWAAMGLPGLRVMSDAEGMKVRGTKALVVGASNARSSSTSLLGNSTSSAKSSNAYIAGGNKRAAGINGSGAFSVGGVSSSAAAAGGFSAAAGF
jgi:hypothetical protein